MAKRYGTLWPAIIDAENIDAAARKAQAGKSRSWSVRRFNSRRAAAVCDIQHMLETKTFKTSPYQCKTIHEPKKRDIFVLPFYPDRIVQHAVMNVLEPIWDRLMIPDSYACRKGKGQHAGSRRTMQFVRRYKYCLKADISKFYPSIDQEILAGLLRKKIKCRDTLWLLDDIIYSYPGGKNVPIGNFTSQWFGNIYLNELDQLVKHTMKVPYLRYCDDFCLFHDDKRVLHDLRKQIEEYLQSVLQLQYSYAEVFPVAGGVDFLGYRHFPQYILLRKSTAKRVRRRLSRLPGLLADGRIDAGQLRSSVASTRGWLKWACTHNLALSLRLDELDTLVKEH